MCFPVDSGVHGPSAVPHLVPLLMAMEGDDPVENSERGCQLLYDVLQSARSAALHAQDYQQHAHTLLTGTHSMVLSLNIHTSQYSYPKSVTMSVKFVRTEFISTNKLLKSDKAKSKC